MVYADALASAGDPRGELIAVELALATGTGDREALRARRRALRSAHAETWWPGIATLRVRTRRGFVEAIAIRANELDAALALVAREPVCAIELCDAWPAEAIRRLPPVRQLTARALGDAELQALFDAPCAPSIVALDLAACPISEFRPEERLAACTRLSLAGTEVDGDDVAWAHLAQLVELDVSLAVNGRSLVPILRATRDLVTLRASCIDGFDNPTDLLAALGRLQSLAHLEIVRHELDRAELARRLPNLRIVSEAADRATIDLVDETLELAVVNGVAGAWIDGTPRSLDGTFTSSYSIGTHRSPFDAGVVELLLDAISCGAARVLTDTGCAISASLVPRDNVVTASLHVADAAIVLDLEQYID